VNVKIPTKNNFTYISSKNVMTHKIMHSNVAKFWPSSVQDSS